MINRVLQIRILIGKMKSTIFFFFLILTGISIFSSCNKQSTSVAIKGEDWYINDRIVNEDTPAEGLLMNVRMVNSVFEDIGDKIARYTDSFDPEANTNNFIRKIPEYAACGINAITISLQGGSPGYEGAINTAFNPDGSLRYPYLERVKRVIEECDKNSMVIILTCFYQRQHSHKLALNGKKSIKAALVNTVQWIDQMNFTNVVLEVSNEYRHGGFKNWTDGDWIINDEGQTELIKLAKSLKSDLLVSTSAMGNGTYPDMLAREADYITIHFNTTALNDYEKKIQDLKKYNKPVICNEDDKIGIVGASALTISVANGCAWGFMHSKQNQYYPFVFNGAKDDFIVYKRFREVSTRGFTITQSLLEPQASIVITSPTDGQIFKTNKPVEVEIKHPGADLNNSFTIELQINNKSSRELKGELNTTVNFEEPGIYHLTALVHDRKNRVLYRSKTVDIIVEQ